MSQADPRDAIRFAEAVLQLLDRGGFTATYKYAVLLALMDLCLTETSRTGVPPDVLTTRQLAERVVELYWPQTSSFHPDGGIEVLRQNTSGQATIVRAVAAFRERFPALGLAQARAAEPESWARLVDSVEWTLILMPLPRLQVVGRERREVLYDINWGLDIESRKASVTAYQRGLRAAAGSSPASDFDNRILLKDHVGQHLVTLNGLLRPLVHREWTRLVAHINRLDDWKLERFLFGPDREATRRLRPDLRDLQDGRCFYCGDRLPDRVEVDHFIPWARYPNDAIENLVLADERCNRHKRDFIASTDHLESWTARLAPAGRAAADLAAIARARSWESAPGRTVGVARAIYLRLDGSALLWRLEDDFVRADPDLLRRLLAAA